MIRLIAWLLGRPRVQLRDFRGDVYQTWARQDRFGTYAPVYPLMGVGRVQLLEGGEVEQPHYIKEWR